MTEIDPIHDAPTESTVAELALEIVREHAPAPIALATLGQIIKNRLGISTRHILGTKPLSQSLRDQLGSKLEIGGVGKDIRVSLGGSTERFHPGVWAAFAKPIAEHHRRWLTLEPSPHFEDLPDNSVGSGHEVLPEFIADGTLAKSEHAQSVVKNIHAWADGAAVPLASLVASHRMASRSPVASRATTTGVDRLRALIDAIPQSEQKDYSLPLDLIRRLITE